MCGSVLLPVFGKRSWYQLHNHSSSPACSLGAQVISSVSGADYLKSAERLSVDHLRSLLKSVLADLAYKVFPKIKT